MRYARAEGVGRVVAEDVFLVLVSTLRCGGVKRRVEQDSTHKAQQAHGMMVQITQYRDFIVFLKSFDPLGRRWVGARKRV